MVVAVNGAPLVGTTRAWAEARSRVCCGLSLLSAGTPMFFMGEEIGARNRYTYDNFLASRENILMFSRRLRSIRSHDIDIVHQSNTNRVIAFKRWSGDEQVIIVASLNNVSFPDGYVIEKDLLAIPNAAWKEVFNSDSAVYGGQNVGNRSGVIPSVAGRLTVIVPAAGLLVFVKQ